jgi:NhaP-type Na+/H+ or K+/H+ antiporter
MWSHLDVNQPHLVYIIIGAFTSLFMLTSSLFKERLYIGEATVACCVGIMVGPIALGWVDPSNWGGNTDQMTLEFSRIVLVVQCFAVGVELPRRYMNRHWRSVSLLLIPVMTFGWLVTALVIWWMFRQQLTFMGSLCCAACVTATDPVLASSVVGKGKFAKRVPKHLRDLLSAESGCNDGMAFPFIYFALYWLRYGPTAEFARHWVGVTILYECVFGAIFGVTVGYIGRRLIRIAHERGWIDRESFLIFYLAISLFCAGAGSILGMDDLLIGFAAGVGFSNDGWFQEKTEETHVSNVIDLLLNLGFFVYFGTIIPWADYNNPTIGTDSWRLVVVALFVLFFRRIPVMMMFKPVIKDIKTWREALFAGHFGPIGVGALFVAIAAKGELLSHHTTPPATVDPANIHINIIRLVWPITTFLVICSIVVHGSSVAVFTLGKRINTLTLTFSYTNAADDGPSWMDRLPRIQSRSKTSISLRNNEDDASVSPEMTDSPSILGVPRDFLRRRRLEERGSRGGRWDAGIGPGGPISKSAITPASRLRRASSPGPPRSTADRAGLSDSGSTSPSPASPVHAQGAVFREGDDIIVEDKDGNVLAVERRASHADHDLEAQTMARRVLKETAEDSSGRNDQLSSILQPDQPGDSGIRPAIAREGSASWWNRRIEHIRASAARKSDELEKPRRGPARAYTFGHTVIVEDEDGEVIKQYDIPNVASATRPRDVLQRMGSYFSGREGSAASAPEAGASGPGEAAGGMIPGTTSARDHYVPGPRVAAPVDTDDDKIRFKLASGGPRMRKDEFINEIGRRREAGRQSSWSGGDYFDFGQEPVLPQHQQQPAQRSRPSTPTTPSTAAAAQSATDLRVVTSAESAPRGRAVTDALAHFAFEHGGETAAQRRRREIAQAQQQQQQQQQASPSLPQREQRASVQSSPRRRRDASRLAGGGGASSGASAGGGAAHSYLEEGETAAERRRRRAALGLGGSAAADGAGHESSSDDEDGTGFRVLRHPYHQGREGDGAQSESESTGVEDAGGEALGVRRSRARAGGAGAASAEGPATTATTSAGAVDVPTGDRPANVRFVDPSGRVEAAGGSRLRWGDGVGRRP